MTTKIKELIFQKNKLYSRIKKRNNSFLNRALLHTLQQHLSKPIENAKQKTKEKKSRIFFRISEKLKNPNTSIMYYWSLIKTLLNEKKVPCIRAIYDNNRYVKKGQLFILTFQNNALY